MTANCIHTHTHSLIRYSYSRESNWLTQEACWTTWHSYPYSHNAQRCTQSYTHCIRGCLLKPLTAVALSALPQSQTAVTQHTTVAKNSEVTVVALLIPHSICSLRISLQTNRLENGAINQFLIHFSTTTSNTASYLQLSLSQVNETSYSKGLKRDFIASWEHLHEAWKGREEWAAPEGITQACSSQRNANFMRASSQWEGQHSICTLFYFHFH